MINRKEKSQTEVEMSILANISLANGLTCGSLDEQINGFLFVVNPQGRIIFISDNAEYYLRKNVVGVFLCDDI